MTDYYCPQTELIVYRDSDIISPERIRSMNIRDLLDHKVRMFGKEVRLETLACGNIRFQFQGADRNLKYNPGLPAAQLLDGLKHLAGYYDKQTEQFSF